MPWHDQVTFQYARVITRVCSGVVTRLLRHHALRHVLQAIKHGTTRGDMTASAGTRARTAWQPEGGWQAESQEASPAPLPLRRPELR